MKNDTRLYESYPDVLDAARPDPTSTRLIGSLDALFQAEDPPARLRLTIDQLAQGTASANQGRELTERAWHLPLWPVRRVPSDGGTAPSDGQVPPQKSLLQWSSRARPRMWLAAAGAIIAIAISLYLWTNQASTVSAQEILQNARAAANSPLPADLHSFFAVSRSINRPERGIIRGLTGDEQFVNESKRWYQSPDQWRGESTGILIDPAGKEIPGWAWDMISLSDGTDIWNYDVVKKEVVIARSPSRPSGPGSLAPFGQVNDFDQWLGLAGTCFNPKLTGSAIVAGQTTYVIDLGVSQCRSAYTSEVNSRFTVWVDKGTFFILKQEQSTDMGQVIRLWEVTQIQYNVTIDPAQFAFTPPLGVSVTDLRPK